MKRLKFLRELLPLEELWVKFLCFATLFPLFLLCREIVPKRYEIWTALIIAPGIYLAFLLYDWLQVHLFKDVGHRNEPVSCDSIALGVLAVLFGATVLGCAIAQSLQPPRPPPVQPELTREPRIPVETRRAIDNALRERARVRQKSNRK